MRIVRYALIFLFSYFALTQVTAFIFEHAIHAKSGLGIELGMVMLAAYITSKLFSRRLKRYFDRREGLVLTAIGGVGMFGGDYVLLSQTIDELSRLNILAMASVACLLQTIVLGGTLWVLRKKLP